MKTAKVVYEGSGGPDHLLTLMGVGGVESVVASIGAGENSHILGARSNIGRLLLCRSPYFNRQQKATFLNGRACNFPRRSSCRNRDSVLLQDCLTGLTRRVLHLHRGDKVLDDGYMHVRHLLQKASSCQERPVWCRPTTVGNLKNDTSFMHETIQNEHCSSK